MFDSVSLPWVGEFKYLLDLGSIRSSPRDGLRTPYRLTKEQCLTVPPCPYLHGRTAFGPSCTVFVYPGCWYIDNGAKRKFDDVLLEHSGLPHVLLLAVHLLK